MSRGHSRTRAISRSISECNGESGGWKHDSKPLRGKKKQQDYGDSRCINS